MEQDEIKQLKEKIKSLELKLEQLKKILENHTHDGHGYTTKF
jgi:hypothetical protein